MLPPLLALVLGAFPVQSQAPAADPRAVIVAALSAVEGDSVAAARRKWSRAIERNPGDRIALLGLGALARLTYEYATADSLFARVTQLGDTGALADYARMEQAASVLLRGRLREAADLYARAVAGAERRGDSNAMAEALLGLSVPRSRLAAPQEVLALLDRAAALNHHDPVLQANERCQRAGLLARGGGGGGHDVRALAIEGAALARRARHLRQEGRCLQVVAQVHQARGAVDSAAIALGKALPLFERSRDHAALASILQWRGFLYNTVGRYGDARRDLTLAVQEGERAQAMSPIGWSLINLGMVSLGMGDHVAAGEQLRKARDLLQAQGDAWGVATARGMLGGVARAAGDFATARAEYSEVLAWGVKTGTLQTQRNMHDALAAVAQMTGDWDTAEREMELARQVGLAGGRSARRGARAGHLALRRGQLQTAERDFRQQLADLDSAQHSLRYTTRALLAETYARRGALAEAEAELVSASDALDRWRVSLSAQDLRVRAAEFDYGFDPDLGVATVIAALARSGRVASAFALADRRRARELTTQMYLAQALQVSDSAQRQFSVRSAGAPVAEVGFKLPDEHTALLEFAARRGGEPTTLFIVSSGGIASRTLAPIDSLERDLKRFASVLEGGGDARGLGARLGAELLQPAMDALDARVTRLIIVTDDILARVAFDALVLKDGRYAVERFAIALVPSAATLAALQSRASNTRPVRILAFGDPAFGSRGANAKAERESDPGTTIYRSAFDASGGLPRLAASRREARRVARYAPDAEVRLGGAASESYVRAASLDEFRVLHFATHALVDEAAVTRTALALAPGGGEDGFLGPADLASLELNADLVVLSACRTAGGLVLKGEGVQGLTAPLLQAGARSVVATVWRIADESTMPVIDRFYSNLAAGNAVGDALRAAKLDAIARGMSPTDWAAFVVIGDPMVRVPLVQPASVPMTPWLAATAALVVVAGLYGWMRKRTGAAAA